MTRDQWLRRCAQRFIDRAEVDPGSAAGMANEAAIIQQQEHGRSPGKWDRPEDAADEELSYWADDEGAG